MELALLRHKMAFISGPRQTGKTTETTIIGEHFDESLYFNWDQTLFKKRWTKTPDDVVNDFNLEKSHSTKLLILDEIHKSKAWKQKIKGLYDVYQDILQILVTGSARLNIYKKGSDSLMGRYLHFRLHPFSLRELLYLPPQNPHNFLKSILSRPSPSLNSPSGETSVQILKRLFTYSGFPEPYLAQKNNILNLWKNGRKEKIIREDLRDLSHIKEISLIEVLISLLPEKVGSPLSIQSLREDMDVAHDTISRWLLLLKELYYLYEIKPYSKAIKNSLRKSGKIYFYDWTEVPEDGPRFENLIASHLLKACLRFPKFIGHFFLCEVIDNAWRSDGREKIKKNIYRRV